MKKVFTLSIIAFLIFLVEGGCQHKTNHITTGNPVVLTTETIGPEGGTITINKAGDPLNGYSITVPAGAYNKSVSFTISYSPILSHTYGKSLSFISPLIKVDNGGDYAINAMTIKIPVQVPDGHFAMAFYYDDTTGELQGVPMRKSEQKLLTVATKHFSEMAVADGEEPNLEDEVESKFTQGIDNWQFVNWGSYIAPLGHCAGQSLAAMYYFSEKKIKENKPALFGLYDDYKNPYQKTPDLQWDDMLAYRLCSMAQLEENKVVDPDIDTEQDISELLSFDDLKDLNDKSTFNAYCLSMLVTEMPQLVFVSHVDEKGKRTGHALIVYKCVGTELYVSDPNYPSGQNSANRKIVYDPTTEKFQPYISGRNAQEPGTKFEIIEYQGPIGAFDTKPLAKLWDDFEAGTVGQDTFPHYTIMVKETFPDGTEADVELTNNYETTDQQITVYIDPTDFDPQVTLYKGTPYPPQKGDTIAGSQTFAIPLNEGVNSLGFQVDGKVKGGEAQGQYRWVGFNWVNVNRKKATSSTTTSVEATTTSSSTTTITTTTTSTGGDLSASACNATGDLSVRASTPRYRTENGIKYCVADLYVKNNGSDAVGVIGFNAKDNYWSGWAPYFLPGEESNLYQFWQAASDNGTDFNDQLEGDVPKITALKCLDPNGAEPCTGCFWIYTSINANNQLPAGMQTIDISSLNPCTGKVP